VLDRAAFREASIRTELSGNDCWKVAAAGHDDLAPVLELHRGLSARGVVAAASVVPDLERHSKIALASSMRVFHRQWGSSTCIRDQNDAITALTGR
jgi:hypothetical protein